MNFHQSPKKNFKPAAMKVFSFVARDFKEIFMRILQFVFDCVFKYFKLLFVCLTGANF